MKSFRRKSVAKQWKEFGVNAMQHRIKQTEVTLQEDLQTVIIKCEAKVAPPVIAWGFDVTYVYTIRADGSILVEIKGVKAGQGPNISAANRCRDDVKKHVRCCRVVWLRSE